MPIKKPNKKPRGRPKVPDIVKFLRTSAVIGAYGQLRKSGLDRNQAIKGTVAKVKERLDGIAISETEVKNILANAHPEGMNSDVLLVETSDDLLSGAIKIGKRPKFGERGKQRNRKSINFKKNP
jgi:hypothetical protein